MGKMRRAQAMTRFPDFWMVSFLAKMPALIPPMFLYIRIPAYMHAGN